jgi:hypothetical protein
MTTKSLEKEHFNVKSDAQKVLSLALTDHYNVHNDLKCKIRIFHGKHDQLDIQLVLKNEGNKIIRTPLSPMSWTQDFNLLIFNEDTLELLSSITMYARSLDQKEVVIGPQQALVTTYKNVLSRFDDHTVNDVMFVACSIPHTKFDQFSCHRALSIETDPFSSKFWTDTIWKMHEDFWTGDRFISNVLKTSQVFNL